MSLRQDLVSAGLNRISVKTLKLAKEKYDRGRKEHKVSPLCIRP
jgi:hypothetical protein